MLPKMFPLSHPPTHVLKVHGLAQVNAPVQVRNRVQRFGDLTSPGPAGQPPPRLGPYGEAGQVYNPQGTPSSGAQSLANGGASTPLGQSGADWFNPCTYATVPLNATNTFSNGLTPAVPVLQQNYKRNSLIIQNQSVATAPDTAPTYYVDFNHQPAIGGSLALPPGFGFYWSASDCPPRDAVYIITGPFIGGGGTVQILGCIIQGTYVPQG